MSLFQQIRSEIEKINHNETKIIYKINYYDCNGEDSCYIGVTKWKIKTCVNKYERDIEHNKQYTIFSCLYQKQDIHIDFKGVKSYLTTRQCGSLQPQAVEIISTKDNCNTTQNMCKLLQMSLKALWDKRW